MADRYVTRSPLERVFGDQASTLHLFIDDLWHQTVEWYESPAKRRKELSYQTRAKDATEANREFLRAVNAGERQLREMFHKHIIPHIERSKLGPQQVSETYVTQAVCPLVKSRVVRRTPLNGSISGKTDFSLAERYSPACPACSKGEPFIHNTERSYVIMVPEQLEDSFTIIDTQTNNIASIKGQLQRLLKHSGPAARHLREAVQKAYEVRAGYERDLQRSLRVYESEASFASLRVKYAGRLKEKIMRMWILELIAAKERDLREETPDTDQISDVYAGRIVVPTRAQGLSLLKDLLGEWRKEYGDDALTYTKRVLDCKFSRASRSTTRVGEYIIDTNKESHKSYKTYLQYRDIVIELMAMTPQHFLEDRNDHISYERRQLNELQAATEKGIPVKRIAAALDEIL